MVLLRHLLGDALRRLRLRQGRTLREVSGSARVSLGYLSEVERGQKEASSELLAAICSALGIPLSHVLREVSDNFALAELQNENVFADVVETPARVAVEIAGAGHAGGNGERPGEQVPVGSGQVASALRIGLSGSAAAGPTRSLRQALPGHHTGLPPFSAGIGADDTSVPVGEPVFDQVTRTAREITDMVPV